MEKSKPQIRFNGFDEDWENYYLKSLCENIEYGLNAASKPYDGVNKYLRITDIDDETREFLLKDVTSPDLNLSEADNFLLQKGDILFARTGASVGKSYHYNKQNGKVYYAGFLIRARIKKGFNSELVFQNTLTDEYNKFIRITSQRSGQPGVNAQEYGEFSFHLPKIEKEQFQISTFFKNLDKLLTEHQQKHNKLKALKKAMLSKMFPQQGQTIPEIRFKGFGGDWEPYTFKSLADLKRGLTYTPQNITNNDGVKVLRSSNIYDDLFVQKEDDVFVREDAINIEYVKQNDILITSANGSSRLVGKHALINNLNSKAVHGGFMLLASAKNPYFLNASMDTEWYYKFVTKFTAGGGGSIGNLNKNHLEEQIVLAPKDNEQKKIGNFFKNLESLIFNHQIQIEKLQNIKKAFLAKMFI